jgi:hypothetical protein
LKRLQLNFIQLFQNSICAAAVVSSSYFLVAAIPSAGAIPLAADSKF